VDLITVPAMHIPPSDVIAQTIRVLEEVCLLLDDEIVERTGDRCGLTDDALKCASALEAVRTAIPKLRVAAAALAESDRFHFAQGDLLSDDTARETSSAAGHARAEGSRHGAS
jgi:hypothetical protein